MYGRYLLMPRDFLAREPPLWLNAGRRLTLSFPEVKDDALRLLKGYKL